MVETDISQMVSLLSDKERRLEVSEDIFQAQGLPASKSYRTMAGIDDSTHIMSKLHEISKLLWHSTESTVEEDDQRIARALELYESLKPQDGAEGMLAMQMVGTHDAALECLRRAALPNQSFKGRDMSLKHAHKLMALYTQQLSTLNKHRGKGQQKVTVEYVNVEPGAQAIVGNVEVGSGRQASSQSQGTIEKSDEQIVNASLDAGAKQKQPKLAGRNDPPS